MPLFPGLRNSWWWGQLDGLQRGIGLLFPWDNEVLSNLFLRKEESPPFPLYPGLRRWKGTIF